MTAGTNDQLLIFFQCILILTSKIPGITGYVKPDQWSLTGAWVQTQSKIMSVMRWVTLMRDRMLCSNECNTNKRSWY